VPAYVREAYAEGLRALMQLRWCDVAYRLGTDTTPRLAQRGGCLERPALRRSFEANANMT